MKRTSLKDIALQAGVSTSTVSFILNDKGKDMRISETVIKKVQQIAKKSGYRPNQLAIGLRTGKSKTIGLIIENIGNQFFAGVAKSIEDEAQRFGYKVFYCSTDNDDTKASTLIHTLLDANVDGIIITPTRNIAQEINKLSAAGKPLVLIDRFFPAVRSSYVILNNFEISYDAVQLLINKGYEQICFVTNDIRMNQMQQRLEGYKKCLADNKRRYSRNNVLEIHYEWPKDKIRSAINSFIEVRKLPSAILFATNTLGIVGIEVVRSLGKKIPDEIGIMSFDDHDLFRLNSPAISVIEQPVTSMGSRAVELLIKLIHEKDKRKVFTIVEKGKIIERESI